MTDNIRFHKTRPATIPPVGFVDLFYSRDAESLVLLDSNGDESPIAGGSENYEDLSPAIPPDQVDGLQMWFKADAITPVADGTALSTWSDSSGLGRNLTSASTARPLYKTNMLNGLPSVQFDGTNDYMLTSSIGDSSWNSAGTIIVVARKRGAANGCMLSAACSTGSYYFGNWIQEASFHVHGATVWDVEVPNHYGTEPINAKVYGLLWNGATDEVRVNGAVAGRYGSVNTQTPSLNGSFYLGCLASVATFFNGDIFEVIVYKHALSRTEMTQIDKYLKAKYNVGNGANVTAIGDSLTRGYTYTESSYPKQMADLLGTSLDVVNSGIDSKTLTSMLTEGVDLVDNVNRQNVQNILLVWAGTNDIGTGSTAVQTHDRLVAYCKARRLAGKKVIVATCIDRLWTTGSDAIRTAYNDLILANWRSYSDGLAHYAGDPVLGVVGASNNTTYYNADKLHLKTAGYGRAAAIGAEAVREVMGIGTVTIIPAGTTGAQTILAKRGRVNFAAAATSLVVTNYLCLATSIIECQIATNDTTAAGLKVVPANGSFTIYLTTAPTAETAVSFTIR